MTVIGVICEYNPFHNGHKYHLSKIRKEYGEDSVIVGFMSGNFTQRGECAFLDKYERAQIAIRSGCDLIVEIPFPFCAASAPLYAQAGVSLSKSLDVDVLSFGSEAGDIGVLWEAADNMRSEVFCTAWNGLMTTDGRSGYASQMQKAYEIAFGKEKAAVLSSPNNILAIEYLNALKNTGILPHTVKREGTDYSSEILTFGQNPSASAIRNAVLQNQDVSAYVPASCADVLHRATEQGTLGASLDRVGAALLTSLTINSPKSDGFAEGEGGLYHRLQNKAFESTDLSTLCAKTATKKYTDARIRRAILFSYFGVTSSDLKTPVAFTHLLGADARGLSLVKRVKKECDFPIITKPSVMEGLSVSARKQKDLSDRADVLFGLSLPVPAAPCEVWKKTPYIEN